MMCMCYRTVAAAVELYYVDAEVYSYSSSTATAATNCDSIILRSCAVGHRVLPELGVGCTAD